MFKIKGFTLAGDFTLTWDGKLLKPPDVVSQAAYNILTMASRQATVGPPTGPFYRDAIKDPIGVQFLAVQYLEGVTVEGDAPTLPAPPSDLIV